MFNIKVFLIFSYSSVFDKIRHRRQRFLSAGSPAAVWCVVVWSRFNLRVGIHSKIMKIKKKKTTHMNLWAEPQLVCTWKCFLNVHCQCDAVLTLSMFCTCASLRLLYCQTGPEDVETTAGPRCQSKAAARRVHVHAEFKVDDLSFTDLVCHPENGDSRPRCLFCNINSVFHTVFSSFFSSLCNSIMSFSSPYVFMYEWLYSAFSSEWSFTHYLNTYLGNYLVLGFFCMYFCFLSFLSLFPSRLLFPEFHWCCCNNRMDPVADMTFPRGGPAFCNDCKKCKCFTAHFRAFVVINKTDLNEIWVDF